MMRLKVIAFILSLLMVMQMLPLSQIGQALGSNLWTEELPHNDDAPLKGDAVNYNHPFLPPTNYLTIGAGYCIEKALAYIHLSEQIPPNHSTEIISPPPDVI